MADSDPSVKYMTNLFNGRRESYGLVDRLDNVNDTRNGILLYRGFHGDFDAGDIAFLMVCDLFPFLSIACNSGIQ